MEKENLQEEEFYREANQHGGRRVGIFVVVGGVMLSLVGVAAWHSWHSTQTVASASEKNVIGDYTVNGVEIDGTDDSGMPTSKKRVCGGLLRDAPRIWCNSCKVGDEVEAFDLSAIPLPAGGKRVLKTGKIKNIGGRTVKKGTTITSERRLFFWDAVREATKNLETIEEGRYFYIGWDDGTESTRVPGDLVWTKDGKNLCAAPSTGMCREGDVVWTNSEKGWFPARILKMPQKCRTQRKGETAWMTMSECFACKDCYKKRGRAGKCECGGGLDAKWFDEEGVRKVFGADENPSVGPTDSWKWIARDIRGKSGSWLNCNMIGRLSPEFDKEFPGNQ